MRGGLDPTVVNGGIINAYGTNARLGAGEWMVVEADESDGTFLRLPATIAVVTNVDPEHLDFYGDLRAREARRLPELRRECAVLRLRGAVHSIIPKCRRWSARIRDRRIITYGFSPQADVRAVNVRFSEGASHFDVVFRDRRKGTETRIEDLQPADAGRAQCPERAGRHRGRARARRSATTRSARRSPSSAA